MICFQWLKFLFLTCLLYALCACNNNTPHEVVSVDVPICVNAGKDAPKVSSTDTILGDFDGDDILEKMWLVPPDSLTNDDDCVGGCTSYIHFSNPNIPTIKIESSIGGAPVNHGDLNNNGTDEIGLLPDWFSSCWRQYYVWTLLNGKWELAVPPIHTNCYQWEEGVLPIEIDTSKDGYVIIRHTELIDEEFSIITESIPIKR